MEISVRGLWVAWALWTIVVSGACVHERDVGGEPMHRVRFAFGPDSLSTVYFFTAEERELFARAGIATDHVELASGNDQLNALISGQADILPAVSIVPVLHLEIQRPGTVRVFSHSVITSEASFDKVIVRVDSPYQTLGDLSHKTVGVFPGTTATNLFRAVVEAQGIDPASVAFVQLPSHIQLPSLRAGAIDALLSYEPMTTVAVASGEFRVLYGSVNAALMSEAPTGVSVVARDFERNAPRLSQQVIEILDEGIVIARREPVAARALLPRITEMTEEVAKMVHINHLTLSDEMDVDLLQTFIELLHRTGEIPQVVSAADLVSRE